MQTHSNFFHLCDVDATSESLFVVVKKSERTRSFCFQDYLLTMKDVRTCKLQAKLVVCTSHCRRRRRRYFYLARVTLTVTKTDILRGPRSLKTKHDNNRNMKIC